MTVIKIPDPNERCAFCKKKNHTKLCDFVVDEIWNSKDFKTSRITCDAKICDDCSFNLGYEFDFCPYHLELTRKKMK